MKRRAFIILLGLVVGMTAFSLARSYARTGTSHLSQSYSFRVSSEKNSSEIAVVDPQKRFIWMRNDNLECSGLMYKDGILSISPSHAYGRYWRDGISHDIPIFVEDGVYTVLISDNLETELENSATLQYRVRFSNALKKNKLIGGCKDVQASNR